MITQQDPNRLLRPYALGIVLGVALLQSGVEGNDSFYRSGDVDGNGALTIIDAIAVVAILFADEAPPVSCLDAADFNEDGAVEVTDAVLLLRRVFEPTIRQRRTPWRCRPTAARNPLGCQSFPYCNRRFYSELFEGDGTFFVVDRSSDIQDSGSLSFAQRELSERIRWFEQEHQFALVFYDQDLQVFPPEGGAVAATEANVEAAIGWVRQVQGGRGSCFRKALLAALAQAEASIAEHPEIVLITDGDSGCMRTDSDRQRYWRETLSLVSEANTESIPIHAILNYTPDAGNAAFMEDLVARNGGRFIDRSN